MNTQRSLPWKYLQAIARFLAEVWFELKVYGGQHIPEHGGALIVSNHQSNLDPILLPVRLNRPMHYIAKSELFTNRWFGWFLRSILNTFPVHKGEGDVRAVRETIHRLQQGHLMNVFPEGRRTRDGEIAPLQRGVALIVERARVPIVPAVIVGTFEAWPIHRRYPRRGRVRIRFGPQLDLVGLERDEIMRRIEKTLHVMYDELRAETAAEAEVTV